MYKRYITKLKHYFKFVTNGSCQEVSHGHRYIQVKDKTRFYSFDFSNMMFEISPPHCFCDKNYKRELVSFPFLLEDVSSLNKFKAYFKKTVKPYRIRQDENQTKSVLNCEGKYEKFNTYGIPWQRPVEDTSSHTSVIFRGLFGNGYKQVIGNLQILYNLERLYTPYHEFIFQYLYRRHIPRIYQVEINTELLNKFDERCASIDIKNKYKYKIETPYPMLLNTDLDMSWKDIKLLDINQVIRVRKHKVTQKLKREYLVRGIQKLLKRKHIRWVC